MNQDDRLFAGGLDAPAYLEGDLGGPLRVPSNPPLHEPFPRIKVPGAGAKKYFGREIFNSLLRYIMSSQCKLGHFARSLLSRHCSRTEDSTETKTRYLPMPLPYPEVLLKRKSSKLDAAECARKKAVNSIVLVLNFLHLGQPMKAPSVCRPGNRLSKFQWAAVKRFEGLLDAWLACGVVGPEQMGRTASKIESIEASLAELTSHAVSCLKGGAEKYFPNSRDCNAGAVDASFVGEVIGKSRHAAFSSFKAIEADRLKFIGEPSFNPLPYLDTPSQDVYARPLSMSIPPKDYAGSVPHVRVHCSKDEKMKLFHLLDHSRRLSLHPESQIRPRYTSGLFSVVKSLEFDRLILDSRPPNILEIPCQRFIRSLASADSLCKIFIPQGHSLKSSGNDLRDFYYLFSVSDERCRRNALAGPICVEDAKQFSCFREELDCGEAIFGALSTLAMGDTQAVSLAQTCHLGMALQTGIATSENLLTLSGPPPRSSDMIGIIIDDFVALSICKNDHCTLGAATASSDTSPSVGAQLSTDMQDFYKTVGLIPHEGKAFRDEISSSFWGADVDGALGTVRGSLKRCVPLCSIILQIVKLRVCTVELLEIISGSLISLLLFRRRMLVLLEGLFHVTRDRAQNDVIRLSNNLINELLVIVTLLPLACTNLRADFNPIVVATDASDWGEGAVFAKVKPSIAKELHRHGLRKSVWSKLLAPSQAWQRSKGLLESDQELPDESYQSNPLWTLLARALEYHLMFAHAAKGRRRINIGELRSFLKAEKQVGEEQASTRTLYGIDSQVTLGAIVKGRSASMSLNRELRRFLPGVLFHDIYSEYMYYRSKDNPADDPTRGEHLRAPCVSLPSWWEKLELGDFSDFEHWLHQYNISSYDLTGLPPTDELMRGIPEAPERGVSSFSGPPPQAQRETCTFDSIAADENVMTGMPPDAAGEMSSEQTSTGPADSDVVGSISGHGVVFHSWFGDLNAAESAEVFSLLASFDTSQVFFPESSSSWPPTSYGFLDLFSGEKGVAKQYQQHSDVWTLTFDIEHSAKEDLSDKLLQHKLERLLQLGAFCGWGAAPVCSSFSTAITPPVRSINEPWGLSTASPGMKEKMQAGNRSAMWLLQMMKISLLLGIHFWLENPDLSWLFRLPPWKRFVEKHSEKIGFWRLDYCRYGTRWRKRTRILTSSVLKGHRTFCLGCASHLKLRGRSSAHRASWTRVAQPYPTGVCKAIAMGMCITLGFHERRQFDPASCARCSHMRIGEAGHPGPASRDRSMLLESVPLIEAKTAALQTRFWKWFNQWLDEHLSSSAKNALLAHPATLCQLVKEFGNHLYSSGKTLHVLRHLVVYVQKTFVATRPFMSINWDMIARWEKLEPPIHRTPIPGSILRAMVVIGVLLNWKRFSGVLCLAFFGITRPGEVLRASRKDLVLAGDLLLPDSSVAYLRVGEPKPRGRGKGRVQHASIHEPKVISFIEHIFGHVHKTDMLYGVSPNTFRRRWNHALQILLVPSEARLTPGSLRGGGAVEAYRSGMELTKLCWRMRLKNLATLESYIQEVAADAFLVELSDTARKRIQLFASAFDSVLISR